MKLKPRKPMTALDAHVYGRLGAVSMSPASADKRFRAQLKERNVVVAGLTDGERRQHAPVGAQAPQGRSGARAARSSPNQCGPATGGPTTCCIGSSDNGDAVPRGYGIGWIWITFSTVEPKMDAIESELGHR